MLDEIFARQLELQTKSFGVNPSKLTGDDMSRYVQAMSLGLTDEVHEALNEIGWKPWATSRHVNREAFVGELVDALHFLVNLFLLVGADAPEVYERYIEKSQRNKKRQTEGYDGVTGKCPTCSRALDDK